MAYIPPQGGGQPTGSTGTIVSHVPASTVAGTAVSWHVVVLWFLGGIALVALADPAPQIATALVLLLILGTLLNNWPVYKSYLGIK